MLQNETAKTNQGLTAGKYYLTNDIDFNNQEISFYARFNGVLDGRGYGLKNIKVVIRGAEEGFISHLSYSGILRNLNFTGITISNASNPIGGLIGMSHGLIENCYFDVTILSTGGGGHLTSVIGVNMGRVKNVLAVTTITGTMHPLAAENPKALIGLQKNVGGDTGYTTNSFAVTNVSNIFFVGGESVSGIINMTENIEDSGIKTDNEIKNASLYTSWDLSIWQISHGSYPVLKNQ